MLAQLTLIRPHSRSILPRGKVRKKVFDLLEELSLVKSTSLSTTDNSLWRVMMLVRPAVQMLVEAAIRQASSKSIELSPDTVLVDVGLDSLDTINIEISIETSTRP
jgi:hypothetical protein